MFREESLLELMKEQNMLSLNRQNIWVLGSESSFVDNVLTVFEDAAGASPGPAATILAPILPGSTWRVTTSAVFTVGSVFINFGGNLIFISGANVVNTVTVDKSTTDTINPKIIVQQVTPGGNVDVTVSQFKIQLMDDFLKEQDIRGYFGRNDIVDNGINN